MSIYTSVIKTPFPPRTALTCNLTPEIGHLTNMDTFFCPTSVLMKGVLLYYEVRERPSE